MRFPLGELTKPQVREIARAAGLPVAEKRESQDLCFLAGTSRERFLARHARLRDESGEVVDERGRVLGRHGGHRRYTVGQRRGLGVAAGEPLYVLATDAAANRVVVGPRGAARGPRGARRAGAVLHRAAAPRGPREAALPLGARRAAPSTSAARRARIELESSTSRPLGVAPGQTACLMEGDRVSATARSQLRSCTHLEPPMASPLLG